VVHRGDGGFSVTVYWLVYRSRDWLRRRRGLRATAAEPDVKAGLILATILVLAALGLDFLAPLFLNS